MTADQLARRCQTQSFAKVNLAVILEPVGQLRREGMEIRAIMDTDVLALEGLHEHLSNAVGLRATKPGEAGGRAQAHREFDGFVGSVSASLWDSY